MTDEALDLSTMAPAGEDHVIPFQVEKLDVRGTAVQLGPMLNGILDGHNYPEPVARLLAEVICLNVLLGSSLKFSGRFIIQTDSDGPVSLLVVDFSTPNEVRAYARYDEEKLAELVAEGKTDTGSLMGKGVLAMTITQAGSSQPYQGIVALEGQSMEEISHQYFHQSEQIPTKVRLSVAQLVEKDEDGGARSTWRAGGLMAQFLPEAPERMKQPDIHPGDDPNKPSGEELDEEAIEFVADDAWVEAQSLVATIQDDELTDPQIGTEKLLYRLFHENGVHIYAATKAINKCGCSKEKIITIVKAFSEQERKEAFAAGNRPGVISSKCEFCGTQYEISEAEIAD